MSTHGTGTMELKSWDEQPFSEVEGAPNLSRASVSNAFHGAIEGEGTLEYLMIYREDGSAGYVGVQRVVGRIGERAGSFVLQESGAFENGAASSTWFVVPGSGAGELRGLRGEGAFTARHQQPTPYTLDYDFE